MKQRPPAFASAPAVEGAQDKPTLAYRSRLRDMPVSRARQRQFIDELAHFDDHARGRLAEGERLEEARAKGIDRYGESFERAVLQQLQWRKAKKARQAHVRAGRRGREDTCQDTAPAGHSGRQRGTQHQDSQAPDGPGTGTSDARRTRS